MLAAITGRPQDHSRENLQAYLFVLHPFALLPAANNHRHLSACNLLLFHAEEGGAPST
jgi:hypothetical protein